MKILFEVYEGKQLEVVDPGLSPEVNLKIVLKEANSNDAYRILRYDPKTLKVEDISQELVSLYDGPVDDTAPPWLQALDFFDQLVSEDLLERKEWADHFRELRDVA